MSSGVQITLTTQIKNNHKTSRRGEKWKSLTLIKKN